MTYQARVRWLHLSDFHAGKDLIGQTHQSEYVLDHIHEQLRQGSEVDLVFVTGDVANTGDVNEYDTFSREFLAPAKALLPQARFFLVPGNHDLDHKQVPFVFRDVIVRRAKCFFDYDSKGCKAREELGSRSPSELRINELGEGR